LSNSDGFPIVNFLLPRIEDDLFLIIGKVSKELSHHDSFRLIGWSFIINLYIFAILTPYRLLVFLQLPLLIRVTD